MERPILFTWIEPLTKADIAWAKKSLIKYYKEKGIPLQQV